MAKIKSKSPHEVSEAQVIEALKKYATDNDVTYKKAAEKYRTEEDFAAQIRATIK